MGRDVTNKSISEGATKKASAWGRLFFLPFFLAGAAIIFFLSLRPASLVLRALAWESTPCLIQSSYVETHLGDDGDTYSIEIRYSYEFGGTEFHGDRYSFSNLSSSGRRGKQEVVDRFPVGSSRYCYVNPADPAKAVLNRRFTWDMLLLGLFGLPFLLIGAGGLFYSGRMTDLATKAKSGKGRVGKVSTKQEVVSGALKLKSDTTPLKSFLGMLFVALFWNGIVSVFVWQMLAGFKRGNPEWFLVIFLVPFELIGLAFIVGVVYQFMALFNPRIEVMLDPGSPAIGANVGLGYVVTGAAHRLSSLVITLEGSEIATYRRGTTTYTDVSVFHRQTLLESAQPRDFKFGKARFTVPDPAMHSFKTKSNEIRWAIKVKGGIQRWPDLSCDFTIRVLPKAVEGPAT